MIQLRVKLNRRGSGKRGKLDQTANQLRVEIYMQFGLTVSLLAAFATVPLLAQVSKKGQVPRSPLQEPVEEEELVLLTFAHAGLKQPSVPG